MADAPLQLIIGNYNTSSWSLRASLVLRLARLAFTEVRIPLRTEATPGRIARYSPSGKVPVLIADGVPVWDTLAIAEFVAELEPAVWPVDPKRRAEARSISAEMHSGFADLRRLMPMDVVSRFSSPGRMPKGLAADINRIKDIWRSCRHRFGEDGPFLFGAFSVADAMMAPVTTRFVTHGVPIDGAVEDYVDSVMSWPDMVAWCNAAAVEQDERRQSVELSVRETQQSGRALSDVIGIHGNGNVPPLTAPFMAEDHFFEPHAAATEPTAAPEVPAAATLPETEAPEPVDQQPAVATPEPEIAEEVVEPATASTIVAAAPSIPASEPTAEVTAPSVSAVEATPATDMPLEVAADSLPDSEIEETQPSGIFVRRTAEPAALEPTAASGEPPAQPASDHEPPGTLPPKAMDMPPLQPGVDPQAIRRKLGWIRQPVPSAYLSDEGVPKDRDSPSGSAEDDKPADVEKDKKPAPPATSAVKPIGGGILRRR